MKKEIKIAGAGPAGLSAAINLAKAGYKATVYEQNSDVGFKSNGDFQGLENWTTDEDTLKALKRMNIKPLFKYTPMKSFEMYDYKSRKYLLKSKKPICYLIQRGNAKGTLDASLKKQALEAGVKIIFKKRLPESKADIVATGAAKHIAVGEGIKFKTDLPNTVMSIADDKLSPELYAYLIVVNKQACLITCIFSDQKKNAQKLVDKTIKRFQKLKKFKIQNKKPIGCGINFQIRDSAIKNKRRYAGEAAGFQDYLFGFGIMYAITSGYLAAKSIIEHKNYDTLWKDEFGAILKQGISNRLRYSYASSEQYVSILKKAEKTDALAFFAKWYRPDIIKAILYPFAKTLYKDRNIFK
ncbi:NAD(P)/FAD-dependent oxidoreductase [Candidatus Woesearchaeota archaeon]|nr:NAD(P)/FAD-dependent oxidoreductase [Candidatus Woesearchaeota archaeon]MBW3005772.1 NAD(P)/FAD-dependent oxidoreductase [Candidatus Woesearchaeota archaeon]